MQSDAERLDVIYQLYESYRASAFAGVPDVEVADLLAWPASEYLLLDVRKTGERAVSTISNVISVEDFEREREPSAGRKLVVYCTIGFRSGRYAGKLRAEGWNAANLRGGILAWAHARGELEDPQGLKTRRVHVYGKPWNLLPDSYEAVW